MVLNRSQGDVYLLLDDQWYSLLPVMKDLNFALNAAY